MCGPRASECCLEPSSVLPAMSMFHLLQNVTCPHATLFDLALNLHPSTYQRIPLLSRRSSFHSYRTTSRLTSGHCSKTSPAGSALCPRSSQYAAFHTATTAFALALCSRLERRAAFGLRLYGAHTVGCLNGPALSLTLAHTDCASLAMPTKHSTTRTPAASQAAASMAHAIAGMASAATCVNTS